ncbi:hypothetical protein [Nocardia vinacea]|uniref:hypothetical protein n=1 Tax=Nocardia vinacea TaxID=96468 RepID=UPI0003115CFB|nr:hypothetical protein [Nocardia vinacea]
MHPHGPSPAAAHPPEPVPSGLYPQGAIPPGAYPQMPYPPGMYPPGLHARGPVVLPRPEPPEDIRTARQLWWGVIGFGILQMIGSVVAAFQQRKDFAQKMFDQVHVGDPNFTMADAELMVSLAFVVAVVIGLALAAFALLFVHQLVRGKLWARTLLTAVGVWLVLVAVGTLFALEAVTGAASLVAGAAAIVQGVLAAGAVYLSHRPDSTAYFQMNRR